VLEEEGAEPGVLLLGGCAVPYYAWDRVADLLPGRRIVRMDRPGFAGSRWPGWLPTLAEEMATLIELIGQLGLVGERPVVVAHSMAGPHAEALARARPELVRGLVLVDASVEREPNTPASPHGARTAADVSRRLLDRFPRMRPLGSFADRLLTSFQSNELRLRTSRSEEQRLVFRDPDSVAYVLAEQAAYHHQLTDLATVRDARNWPGVPVRVLTAGGEGGRRWVDVQGWLTELLDGRQTVVPDSRHLMMNDRPDVIAAAVLELVG
jgi:pimeloyl-ACP methyl ester carboxylesterase